MKTRGFTLIELMVVVSIIGILAVIALPKFADLRRKASEGQLKGNLGTIRSALSIYYTDMDGWYPGPTSGTDYTCCLETLTINGKYLAAVPPAPVAPYHTIPNGCFSVDVNNPYYLCVVIEIAGAASTSGFGDFGGGWVYFVDPTEPTFGQVMIGCNHTDTKGAVWSSY